MSDKPEYNQEGQDLWILLKQFTSARIGLGQSGSSLPTHSLLEFRMAHAKARDAVYSELKTEKLMQELSRMHLHSMTVHSQVKNREHFLRHPDAGRKLHPEFYTLLDRLKSDREDIALIIGDGLSADAVNNHAVPLIYELKQRFDASGWGHTSVILARQARVALSDDIGYALGAQVSVMLIGERPGLSSPDSMGIYITWQPKPGLTDEKRNCISNVRPGGLPIVQAADKIMYLLSQIKLLKISGVELKDEEGLPE